MQGPHEVLAAPHCVAVRDERARRHNSAKNIIIMAELILVGDLLVSYLLEGIQHAAPAGGELHPPDPGVGGALSVHRAGGDLHELLLAKTLHHALALIMALLH